MRKMLVLLLVVLMITSSLFVFVPATVRAENVTATRGDDNGTFEVGPKDPGTWPHSPGYTKQPDDYWKCTATWWHNDYYLHGGGKYPYEYPIQVWRDGESLRIEVNLTIESGPAILPLDKAPVMTIKQKKEWVDQDYGKIEKDGYLEVKADFYSWHNSYASKYPLYVLFSTTVNMNDFGPGLFEINIYVWQDRAWPLSDVRHNVYRMYGLFTFGDINADVKDQHDDVSGEGYATLDLVVNSGTWKVEFWYLGNDSFENVQITKANITGIDTAEMKKDYGYFTPEHPPPRPITYNFTDQDPPGVYVWLVFSVFNTSGGKQLMLYSISPTVHNTLKPGETYAEVLADVPKVHVDIITAKENATVGDNVVISVHTEDNNANLVKVWIIAFYSRNVYQIPDPATSLVQLFFYPLAIFDNGTKNVTVKLTYPGQFNVIVIAKDPDHDRFNITRTWIAVADIVAGGGFWTLEGNPWITFPWESTFNMALMLFAVILLFTRRPTLQVIGIALFFAAFVNWNYAVEYLKSRVMGGLNPLSWRWYV